MVGVPRDEVVPEGEVVVSGDAPEWEGASDEPAADEVECRAEMLGPQAQGERLDKWLVRLAPEFSRSHLQNLIARGCVRLDGQRVEQASRKLRLGQRLEVELQPTDESRAFRAEPMALSIVFEDEHLLVLNKPAGLVVHPAAGHWSGTLMNGLLAHHAGATQLPRAGIVHRLDKDTSGLMVVGKTLPAVTALVRMIAAREVHREYLALAQGALRLAPGEALEIQAPLGRDPQSRIKMAVLASGKLARTDVFMLGQGADEQGRAVSAVHCVLHTGRTHQIRVHLASRGHPLVADAVYGGRPALGLQRQALHAARLSLAHPVPGLPALRLQAPLPPDLAQAWQCAGLPAPSI